MNSSWKIPNATVDDAIIDRIKAQAPNEYFDIQRLCNLLDQGKEQPSDVVLLTQMLLKAGELEASELLLRTNVVEENDVYHIAYRELFNGFANSAASAAMHQFEKQFGVRLDPSDNSKWSLTHFFRRSQPIGVPGSTPSAIRRFLSAPCDIEFILNSSKCIADVSSDSTEVSPDEYLVLTLENEGWSI